MIAHFGTWALGLSLALFFWEFLFVAKVAIIHRRMQKKWLFSQIWLKTKYEIQLFIHPSMFLAKHWKPNIESWQFSPFFSSILAIENLQSPLISGVFFNLANKEKCWDSLVSNLPMWCCKKSLFLFSTANVVESCYSPESHYLLTTCVHRS